MEAQFFGPAYVPSPPIPTVRVARSWQGEGMRLVLCTTSREALHSCMYTIHIRPLPLQEAQRGRAKALLIHLCE